MPDAGLVLTSLTFPTTIDVSRGPVTVTASVGATDGDVGVDAVSLQFNKSFVTPSGLYASFGFYDRVDSFSDGMSANTQTLTSATPSGRYTVEYAYLRDKAGNDRMYEGAELQALGLNTSFEVTGGPPPDTTLPVLTSLTLPTVVDVSQGPVSVPFTLGATDIGLGVDYAVLEFDRTYVTQYGRDNALLFMDRADSFADGSTSTHTLTTASATGVYSITSIYLRDYGGNTHIYGPADLQALGFRTSFEIYNPDTTPWTIVGDDGDNGLSGNFGNDTLNGLGGNDSLIGGAGADSLTGGTGADVFQYFAATESNAAAYDVINDFETGIDRIDLSRLNTTAISVIREGGSSFVFANSPGGAFQLIAPGAAIDGQDFVYSGQHGVYLVGSGAGETLVGSAQADPIVGNGGDDVLIGGAGADAISGGAGADSFAYRAASESNAVGYDNLYDFETGIDRIDVSALNTTALSILRVDGSSFVFADSPGGAFQLVASGRAINAQDIVGLNHGVFLVGSEQADALVGGAGGDCIVAGGGQDYIAGGAGADFLAGGAGADVFAFAALASTIAAPDMIGDFVSGTDRIDLTAARTGPADAYGIAYSGGGSFLFVDLGGDGANDMLIQLANTTLQTSDIAW